MNEVPLRIATLYIPSLFPIYFSELEAKGRLHVRYNIYLHFQSTAQCGAESEANKGNTITREVPLSSLQVPGLDTSSREVDFV